MWNREPIFLNRLVPMSFPIILFKAGSKRGHIWQSSGNFNYLWKYLNQWCYQEGVGQKASGSLYNLIFVPNNIPVVPNSNADFNNSITHEETLIEQWLRDSLSQRVSYSMPHVAVFLNIMQGGKNATMKLSFPHWPSLWWISESWGEVWFLLW